MIVFAPLTLRALELSSYVHFDQKRKSGDSYIIHPLSVALIISRVYPEDENLICAALLHDVVEDSRGEKKVYLEDIRNDFGEDIYELVASVTEDDKSQPWDKRKSEALKKINTMSPRQAVLKSADIIHNAVSYIEFLKSCDDTALGKFNADPIKKVTQISKEHAALKNVFPENPLISDLSELVEQMNHILTKNYL